MCMYPIQVNWQGTSCYSATCTIMWFPNLLSQSVQNEEYNWNISNISIFTHFNLYATVCTSVYRNQIFIPPNLCVYIDSKLYCACGLKLKRHFVILYLYAVMTIKLNFNLLSYWEWKCRRRKLKRRPADLKSIHCSGSYDGIISSSAASTETVNLQGWKANGDTLNYTSIQNIVLGRGVKLSRLLQLINYRPI